MAPVRLLVVDDETEICERTRSFLEKRNFDVSIALTQQEALEQVNKEHPHIVLLDIRLGGDSGLDVLRKIKEIDKDIRVIMVTALDDASSIQQAKALGADDYITKPFTASFLDDFIMQRIARLKF